jgi:glycosyltransferase involved in cell wall biosynthesis
VRVGLVIYGSLDLQSGGFLYDRILVQSLRNGGDEVDVISLPWDTYGKCLSHNFSPRIRARLSAWRGDLLLQDELAHASLFIMNSMLRRRLAVPFVSIVHHLRASERRARFTSAAARCAERAYLRSVDGFVFNGEATRRSVRDLAGRECAGIVAPPGGDRLASTGNGTPSAVRPAPPPLRVLFVGNVVPRKGLLTLLKALSAIPRDTWRLTVAGSPTADPAHFSTVEGFVRNKGLGGNVRMTGLVDDARLAEEFRAHHVLAVPSFHEGFGIVYLEAMGFGVVPIGSSSGGAGEVIQHGQSGFLVDPGNTKALTDILVMLMERPGLLPSMAKAARKRFGQFPGWEPRMREVSAWLHSFAAAGG